MSGNYLKGTFREVSLPDRQTMKPPVLVVDADPNARADVSRSLGAGGLEAVCFAAADEALVGLEHHAPAVAVTSLTLGDGSSGLELTRELLERRGALRVIVHSSADSPEVAREAMRGNAFAFVRKNTEPRELVAQVERAFHEIELETRNRLNHEINEWAEHSDAVGARPAQGHAPEIDEILGQGRRLSSGLFLRHRLQAILSGEVGVEETNRRLGELVCSHPSFAAQVMKLANRSFYGFFDPCRTVEEAISRVGASEIRRVAEMILDRDVSHADFNLYRLSEREYWIRAYCGACVARVMAGEFAEIPSFAYTTSLMRDLGRTVIQRRRDETPGGYLARLDGSLDREREIEELGFDGAAVAAAWLRRGRFPVVLSTAVEYYREPWKAGICESLATLLYLSDRAVRCMNEDPELFPERFAPDARAARLGPEDPYAWLEAAWDAQTNADWILGDASNDWN